MSTKSLRRLTIKAKQSFSGLKPFEGNDASNGTCDNSIPSGTENVFPGLEDFGALRAYMHSIVSDPNHSPPAKESPSRRKRLMGSLRSLTSLRGAQSPSSKEKGKELAEHTVEPESPRTPLRPRRIRPSLALNFEESSPDQPFFDLALRRRSASSSMVVHHSSPVPIPIPAKQEDLLPTAAAQPSGMLPGTIPDSPNLLQLVLDRDNFQDSTAPNSSPLRPQADVVPDPLPTPMPGTNIGFSDEDLIGKPSPPQGNKASLRETSSYFGISANDNSNNSDLSDIVGEAQHLADMAALTNSFTNPNAGRGVMAIAALDEVEKARLFRTRVRRSGSTIEVNNDSDFAESQEGSIMGPFSTPCNELQSTEVDSSSRCFSPINIDHVVFDFPTHNTIDRQPTHETYLVEQVQTQMGLQKQAQLWAATAPQLHTLDDTDPQPVNAWGTQGSLYDGTGYGDESSSASPRPSTSSTVPREDTEVADKNVCTAALVAEDSLAMAHHHEALEEVIRAYAALEEEGASPIGEDMIGDVVADDELAHSTADCSQGA
ncbi:hypothetical protein CC86DRAFT_368883 [Ophiobolus disseminans]|uniref:Uncharacterized protein n=1 Tax=Ophiobolus disseminans TaxID=1469910 RepID=A0A6A7A6E7_9PLEO|nr:hypothetical protein CC86DRAFT_368883 [Ophiobolus disseminans]